jgi:hypothetical protein
MQACDDPHSVYSQETPSVLHALPIRGRGRGQPAPGPHHHDIPASGTGSKGPKHWQISLAYTQAPVLGPVHVPPSMMAAGSAGQPAGFGPVGQKGLPITAPPHVPPAHTSTLPHPYSHESWSVVQGNPIAGALAGQTGLHEPSAAASRVAGPSCDEESAGDPSPPPSAPTVALPPHAAHATKRREASLGFMRAGAYTLASKRAPAGA